MNNDYENILYALHNISEQTKQFQSNNAINKSLELYSNSMKPYTELAEEIQKTLSGSMVEYMKQTIEVMKSLTSLKTEVYSGIFEQLKSINDMTSIDKSNPKLNLQLFADIAPDINDNNPQSSDDDYVVLDENTIQEYEIPETIAIPIGNHRVRISTSLFFTILGILVSIVISLSNSNAELKEQTKILSNILESIDATNSSQKENLEELRSVFPTPDESHESYQQSTDSMNESPNTESEN